ncbi:4-hydroxy-3-methylbut-2-enyl diphosphate reductase [Prolixibacter sp. NT017]|uniref:4-hydroxy-3-methylbut-2-enyl diphosphate reductase n=1 Tax=Prolixibacter sp. NT017 TaxID=2652390 RepID=UPI0012884F77|nr:4-hydroxy-3-methylbut-2-enyl diphosphate reductase [Prolixibacter sp. NT017]GET26621.1 4-hydroxy-3-methylbut-2-enyl diphosphate reductase [Prolixibacter sp. NT017]
MEIEIDSKSGFCFGVVNAIQKAEKTLETEDSLYCLGDIVHNNTEVERLSRKGLKTIDHKQFFQLKDCTVLLRAHGEPPSTYEHARKNNITLLDATCPVVLKLQERVRKGQSQQEARNGQVVIYGKKGHAEVNGLVGQTNDKAIVIQSPDDLEQIDFDRPVELFSQTTKDMEGFYQLAEAIKQRGTEVIIHDTLCRQVSNRVPRIREFARRFDLVLFVSGKKSSNGKMLFGISKETNPNSKFISSPDEVEAEWLENIQKVGICGATSTPWHLMEDVAEKVRILTK